MAADAGTKFQSNFKSPKGGLHNVYAETEDEFVEGLRVLYRNATAILETENVLVAVDLATRELGAVPVAVSRAVEATQSAGNVTSIQEASPISPPAPPVTQSAAQGPACKHGAMTFRTNKPGAAKTWKAWMCPSPKGTPDACDPQWIR